MRLENVASREFSNGQFLGYEFDEISLFRFSKLETGLHVSISNIDDLEEVESYIIQTQIPEGSSPCLTEDHICVPTSASELLLIDKFTGDIIKQIEIGRNLPVSKIYHKNHSLVFLSSVPIAAGRPMKPDTHNLIFCNPLNNTRKQTSGIRGEHVSCKFDSDRIYLAVDNIFLCYDYTGKYVNHTRTPIKETNNILINKDFVTLISNNGSAHVLTKNMNWKKVAPIANSISSSCGIGNLVYCLTDEKLLVLDLEKLKIRRSSLHGVKNFSNQVKIGNQLIVGLDNGYVLILSENELDNSYLKTSSESIKQISLFRNFLLVSGDNHSSLLRIQCTT